ncbi:vanadium-dependent haloperoxidase [Noviherbaspirillum suwonense]|uniref:PAP2 superfamily protein n=1 Tax=Noviherbaspirillum suwonense TaxID=1224511 RepID=A0ABY1QMX9_9BURK|nr:vanadium-dependent haloperoxidase [Noviherbaspirillum suwonense]SMP73104.1 PAP2 superfamily protein [Noviherbaspirillum suwonense]
MKHFKKLPCGISVILATFLFNGASTAQTSRQTASPAQTPLSPRGLSDFSNILSPQADRVAITTKSLLFVRPISPQNDRLGTWNEIALQVTAADHARGPNEGYDQLGPHRSSRAMAIIHIAIYDAVNNITKKYQSFSGSPDGPGNASIDAAIAVAARDTLIAMFPLQKETVLNAYRVDAVSIPGTDEAKQQGEAVGAAAAAAILALRANDNSALAEPDIGTESQASADPQKFVYIKPGIGVWQPDPISNIRVALGYNWGKVTPFIIPRADMFRPTPPPAVDSPQYAELYNEVKRLGGDSSKGTPTERKSVESFRAIFWAYDGTPGLCAPPRLYNQVALQVKEQNKHTLLPLSDISDRARYLALINTAMADAAISAWEAKWHYAYWRPVTAIRYPGDDGNAATTRDASFYPLGAPASNARGPNFTPPFPAYPSGHAVFGGAVFEIMRKFFGETTSVEVVSDEFNGRNRGMGTEPVRGLQPISYMRFVDAEWENARSRIWLGIHWQVDATAGVNEGNEVGRYVFDHAFLPR